MYLSLCVINLIKLILVIKISIKRREKLNKSGIRNPAIISRGVHLPVACFVMSHSLPRSHLEVGSSSLLLCNVTFPHSLPRSHFASRMNILGRDEFRLKWN